MGDHPRVVDAVSGEAATELVVHPAACHGLTGALHHRERLGAPGAPRVSEQELQDHRWWELRCTTEAATCHVIRLAEGGDGSGEIVSSGRGSLGGDGALALLDALGVRGAALAPALGPGHAVPLRPDS